MNIIQQYNLDLFSNDRNKETKVYNLSRLIESFIGLTAESASDKFDYSLKKFKIVKTHRCFSNGWVKLFEIFPNEYGDDAFWIEREGTATKNLPPINIIQEFILELEKELKKELEPSKTKKSFFLLIKDDFNKILKTKLV